MKRLRWFTIVLICGLSFFFNIERLDFQQNAILNIDTNIYLITFIVILAPIFFQKIRFLPKWQILSAVASIFFAYKFLNFFVLDGPLFFSGSQIYLSITELTLMLILAWLSYETAQAIGEFETAVEEITFVDRDIQKISDADDQIQAEMFRSRHNNHPLSVIVIEPKTRTVKSVLNRMIEEAQRGLINHYLVNRLAQELKRQLRRTDLVLVNSNAHRVVLVCPETDGQDSEDLIDFLKDNIEQQLDFSVACGVASFPNEALTFDELVYVAENDLYTEVPMGSTGFFKRAALAGAAS